MWTKKKKQNCKVYPRNGNSFKKCVARNKKRYFCRFKCNVNTCNSNTNSNKEECQKFSAYGALKYLNDRNLPLSWAKFRCGKCETESSSPPPTPPPDCVIWGGCGGGGGDLWWPSVFYSQYDVISIYSHFLFTKIIDYWTCCIRFYIKSNSHYEINI